jgi:hypothetical protein
VLSCAISISRRIKTDEIVKSRHPVENSDECGGFEWRSSASLSN